MPVINRGKCGHCGQPVIWGKLRNGYNRTFHHELVPAHTVAEKERFAVRRGEPFVVDLDGVPHNPNMQVLTPHYCAEYRNSKLLANVEGLSEMLPPGQSEGSARRSREQR